MDTTTRAVPDAQLASRLRLAVMRLARRLRQQGEGLSPSMLSALSSIERLGPVTLGELAEAESVQPPTMTRVAVRLEQEGLVERVPDPTDGRVARLSLSAKGARFVERARGRKNAYLERRLRGLSPRDLAALESAVGALEAIIEEQR